MTKYFFWLTACLIAVNSKAQDKLVLDGKPPAMYVTYTAGNEISLKAISNQFGQSVTRLAALNHLNANAVLKHGAKLKIPVTEYSILRSKGDGSNAPVYHVVIKGDNLYRISKSNNITVANIREWNGLKGDAVKIGQPVIIGFLVNVHAGEMKASEPKKEEQKKAEEATIAKAEVKPEPKVVAPEVKPAHKEEEPKPQVKKETSVAPDTHAAVTAPPAAPKIELNTGYKPREGDEGFFALSYSQHSKEKAQQFHSGDAATFKTISGWTDRKYYVLINDVAPETIVRITAPNNRSICAKVLGPLQETKGGSGLLLRMSNSAASTLGITDPKFTVTVTYFE